MGAWKKVSSRLFVDEDDPKTFGFYCPGCKFEHVIPRPRWGFNGDLEKPTFMPSLLNRWDFADPDRAQKVCHLLITDGNVVYLSDCTHELRGQTVPMAALGFDEES